MDLHYRIYKKFMKNFFLCKDNILDKKMKVLIKSYSFSDRKCVKQMINEIVDFYAVFFTSNNLEKA